MKIRPAGLLSTAAGAAALVFLAAGLVRLFLLRFERGDIWPPYSTLRTDPLGCRALYESLAKCGFQVNRNHAPLHKLDAGPNAAVFFLGDTVGSSPNLERIPAKTAASLNSFVRKGGRLVVTFQPLARQPVDIREHPDSATNVPSCPKEGCGSDKQDGDDFHTRPASCLSTTNWPGVAFIAAQSPSAAPARALQPAISIGLPKTLTSNTALAFTNIAPEWTELYRDANGPVMIERSLGNGSIVLSTLSFFASNEAMRSERHPQLLLWLTGGKPKLIFDETHHGLTHEESFGTIARKHGLQLPLLALVLVGVLFLWKNLLPLVPVFQLEQETAALASGKDSMSGLANLLRRSLSPPSIIEICWKKWKSTGAVSCRCPGRNIVEMSSVISAMRPKPSEQEIVSVYNELARLAAPRGASGSARGGKYKWILRS